MMDMPISLIEQGALRARVTTSSIIVLKVLVCLMTCVLVIIRPCAAEVGGQATTHVIIMVIDGPRYSETWGQAERKYIPHMNKELAPQGVLYVDFRNQGPTYTNAGHTALVTGVYQEINNNGLEYPAHATMFQRYLQLRRADPHDAWVIASKDKLQILSDSTDAQWQHTFVCSSDCGVNGKGVGSGYRDDPQTISRTLDILQQHHPHLVLINVKQPDAAGHQNDWPAYLQGIVDTDAIAARLWAFLQKDAEYAGHTALFITNDHGRHLDGVHDGFVSHGDSCDGCRHISLLALGPDFKRGAVITRRREQIDLAVTAASLLGVSLPDSGGLMMGELFASDPSGSDPQKIPDKETNKDQDKAKTQ